MGKFDLAAAMGLAKVSNLDTVETRMIDVDLLDANPLNFFPVEDDLSDLCESIEVNGLLQPILVTPAEAGHYRIIAGHRRTAALKRLKEQDPERYRQAPCRITRPSSPELEELMLIQTNTEARELGWSVKNTAAERVEKILVKLQQEQGVKLPGKMRTNVARIIKTSEAQLARAKYIAEHLEPEIKNATLTDDAAYKIAHLPAEQQRDLYDHYAAEWGPKLLRYYLTSAAVKEYTDNLAAGRKPFAPKPAAPTPPKQCYRRKSTNGKYPLCDYTRKDRPKTVACPKHVDCCGHCSNRYECAAPCGVLSKDISEHKLTDAWRIGQALMHAREALGWSRKEAAEHLQLIRRDDYSEDSFTLYETGQLQLSARSLADFCKAYAVDPNTILGFTPQLKADVPHGWYCSLYVDYTPKEGELCLVITSDPSCPAFCDTWIARWKDGHFVSALNGRTQSKRNMVCFCPLSELPAGYSFSMEVVGNG